MSPTAARSKALTMNTASPGRHFWQRVMPQRPAVFEQDPADMGTCFGLELSLAAAAPLPPAEPAKAVSLRERARRGFRGS